MKFRTMFYFIYLILIFSVLFSGCVNNPSTAPVTPNTSTPATAPTVEVVSYPASVDTDTNISIDWRVAGGSPGIINETSIIWGFNSSYVADISKYPNMSPRQMGTTTSDFTDTLPITDNNTIYFRAYAIVDGNTVYSDEYYTAIIPPTVGGLY